MTNYNSREMWFFFESNPNANRGRQNTARRFVVFRTSRDYDDDDDDDDGEWEWKEVGVISRKTTGVGSEGTNEGRKLKIIKSISFFDLI